MAHVIPPHGDGLLVTEGRSLEEATAAMILVHGRGGTAEGIIEIGRLLKHSDFTYLAPQAAGNSWYPNSFLAPLDQNQPGLNSGLARIGELIGLASSHGIPHERIVVGGFSQGACLASEFVARNPARYGGLLVFSGGLIGPQGTPRDYPGSLDETPVFIGCSDRDAHIPLERVEESAAVLTRMGALVDKQIYAGMGHTIVKDEIDRAARIVGLTVADSGPGQGGSVGTDAAPLPGARN